jgi:hypothetical protein
MRPGIEADDPDAAGVRDPRRAPAGKRDRREVPQAEIARGTLQPAKDSAGAVRGSSVFLLSPGFLFQLGDQRTEPLLFSLFSHPKHPDQYAESTKQEENAQERRVKDGNFHVFEKRQSSNVG